MYIYYLPSPHSLSTPSTMIVILLACSLPLALAGPTSRIVGGVEAAAHSHPYIASLQRATLGIFWSHSCGCSLIATSWCLTAAHCVDGASASSLRVQLGEHSLSATESSEQRFGVSRVIMHPQYNGNAGGYPNDIALLELNGNAVLGGQVATIPLAQSGQSFLGDDVIIAGWGRTVGGGTLPDRLQEVTMTKISNEDCSSRWSSVQGADINDNHICIFTETKSACNGDSGGPMTYRNGGDDTLIGVTSWGISSCDGSYPSVYTRVSNYVSWIEGFTGPL